MISSERCTAFLPIVTTTQRQRRIPTLWTAASRGTRGFGAGFAGPLLREGGDVRLKRDGIKTIRIECLAHPFLDFGMVFVIGVGQRIEHVGITPWTADILRRAASGWCNQAG
jgi:hypothetical protein